MFNQTESDILSQKVIHTPNFFLILLLIKFQYHSFEVFFISTSEVIYEEYTGEQKGNPKNKYV